MKNGRSLVLGAILWSNTHIAARYLCLSPASVRSSPPAYLPMSFSISRIMPWGTDMASIKRLSSSVPSHQNSGAMKSPPAATEVGKATLADRYPCFPAASHRFSAFLLANQCHAPICSPKGSKIPLLYIPWVAGLVPVMML